MSYFRRLFARWIGSTITTNTKTANPNPAANSHHHTLIQFVLRDETAAVASAQPPFLATAATISACRHLPGSSAPSSSPAIDLKDCPANAFAWSRGKKDQAFISEFGGGHFAEAAPASSVTKLPAGAAPILRRVAA